MFKLIKQHILNNKSNTSFYSHTNFQYMGLLVQVMQIHSPLNIHSDLISDYRSCIMEIGFVCVFDRVNFLSIFFDVLSFKVFAAAPCAHIVKGGLLRCKNKLDKEGR